MLADDRKVELDGLGGILVYRDFSVPDLYYYCSTRPAIARTGGEYQLTLVRYDRPVLGQAGMLSFVVNLDPDPDDVIAMQTQLLAKAPGAQFRAMPWTEGTVTAAIIGGTPVFATPSLLGSNSAVICTGLTTDQYLLLKHRDVGSEPPISVVYSLSFEAFRSQYEFGIEFNESRFKEWVQKKCTANFLFISVEKVETFEELRQSGVIRVTSVNQTGETPPEGLRRAFLQSLQSILIPLPQFAPPPEGGGNTWLIGFDCSTVRDMQNIGRRLDTNMQVAGAVTRKVFLQGAPNRFEEAMSSRGAIELPTSTRFTQNLTLRCQSAFDGQPLKATLVNIEPRTLPLSNHVFDSAHPGEWEVELVHEPGTDSGYSYQCDLRFGEVIGNTASSGSGLIRIRREAAFIDVVVEEYCTYRRYRISSAKDFPWKLLKSVTLTLQGAGSLSFEPPLLQLRPSTTTGTMTAFAAQRVSLDDMFYTAACQPLNGAMFEVQGLPSGAEIFLNPFRQRTVTFQAAPDFDWTRYSRIVVSPYTDGAPLLWAQGKLTLIQGSAPTAFKYWFAGDRKLKYKTAFIPVQNGNTTLVDSKETVEAVVSISGGA